jgi:hypothetical protein
VFYSGKEIFCLVVNLVRIWVLGFQKAEGLVLSC